VLAFAAFRLNRCKGSYLSPFSIKTCSIAHIYNNNE
jgi:hypothetical protein